jgi:hypothetical protein
MAKIGLIQVIRMGWPAHRSSSEKEYASLARAIVFWCAWKSLSHSSRHVATMTSLPPVIPHLRSEMWGTQISHATREIPRSAQDDNAFLTPPLKPEAGLNGHRPGEKNTWILRFAQNDNSFSSE